MTSATDRYISHERYDAPRATLIRRMRWFDWVSFGDLCAALGVTKESTAEYWNFNRVLHGLVEDGLAVRRRVPGVGVQYRLVDRKPRHVGVEAWL